LLEHLIIFDLICATHARGSLNINVFFLPLI
jgi:hypothetical protein